MVIGHSGAPSHLVEFLYLVRMPCFFFISGFLFKEKYLFGVTQFIGRKIKGLYFPFIKWSLIFLLLHNLFFWLNIYNTQYNLDDFKRQIFKIFTLTGSEQLLGGFWFLKELLYASIIAFLSMKLITSLKRKLNKGTLVLLSLLFVILGYVASIAPFKIPTIGSKTLLATAYFIAGYAFKKMNINAQNPLLIGIVGYIATIVTSLFFKANMDVKGLAIFGYFTISIIASVSTIYISKIWGERTGIMDYIGKNTLNILTFHFISFKVVSFLIILINGLPLGKLSAFPVIPNDSNLMWLAYTLAGVILPLIIGGIINKTGTLINTIKQK